MSVGRSTAAVPRLVGLALALCPWPVPARARPLWPPADAERRPGPEAAERRPQPAIESAASLQETALRRAQEGDLGAALELYRRLQRRGLGGLQVPCRIGDVLMALGRLEEAQRSYERACFGERASGGTEAALWAARACYGLAAALDRDERAGSRDVALRRALQLDAGQRSWNGNGNGNGYGYGGGAEFIPAEDREYYQALLQARFGRPCEQEAALRAYLEHAERPLDRDDKSAGPRQPNRYIQRARSRLEQLAGQCNGNSENGNSAQGAHHPEPLGSPRDRDGGHHG